MTPNQAEQQAREICHKEGSYWYQVETEITTALLSAYEEGKREGADRIAELEGVLKDLLELWDSNIDEMCACADGTPDCPNPGPCQMCAARAVLEKGGAK